MKTKKTILVFGTFNPITMAHIHIATLAKEKVNADEVIYVPAKDGFLKGWKGMESKAVMTSDIRVKLMQEALEPLGYKVSTVEIDELSDGKTYNTLAYLRENKIIEESYIVMGIDKVCELERWYMGENLVKENNYIIVDRNNTSLEEVITSSKVAIKYKDNFIPIHDSLYSDTSSTTIRDAYINKDLKSVKNLLPENVYKYLKKTKDVYTI